MLGCRSPVSQGEAPIRSAAATPVLASAALVAALATPGLVSPGEAQPLPGGGSRPVIGCALPLSGPDAAVGVRALRGILLAARVFDSDPSLTGGIAIAVRDTEGTSGGAARAVAELVEDERVVAVVGPVTSRESPGAAVTAQRLRVPIITLTQREGILASGDFVFRSFLTARDEARAVAVYAAKRLLVTRFAVLAPNDRFGRDVAGAFSEEVGARGGRVTRRAFYGRHVEIPGVLGALLDGARGGTAEPWDALFVADDVLAARVVAERLRQAGKERFKLLGTGLWNTPDATVGGVLEGALFAAPFSESDPRPESRAFSDAYRRNFDEAPGPLSAQAHDAAALLIRVLETSGSRRGAEHLRERLQVTAGIEGAAGTLRFEGGRDARRGAILLTIRGGRILPVSTPGAGGHPPAER